MTEPCDTALPWPSHELRADCWRRDRGLVVLYVVAAPILAFVASLELMISGLFRRRTAERWLNGLDHPISTRDYLQGEVRDVVTVTTGAFAGTSVALLLGGSGNSLAPVFGAVIFGSAVGFLVYFHRLSQRLIREASTNAWEPDADPRESIKTLESRWQRGAWKTAWPNVTKLACRYPDRSFRALWKRAVASHWRTVFATVVPMAVVCATVTWAVFESSAIAAISATVWVISSLVGILLSIASSYWTAQWDLNKDIARMRVLEDRVQHAAVKEHRETEVVDRLARIERHMAKLAAQSDTSPNTSKPTGLLSLLRRAIT